LQCRKWFGQHQEKAMAIDFVESILGVENGQHELYPDAGGMKQHHAIG
jgi:hypothetical protein